MILVLKGLAPAAGGAGKVRLAPVAGEQVREAPRARFRSQDRDCDLVLKRRLRWETVRKRSSGGEARQQRRDG